MPETPDFFDNMRTAGVSDIVEQRKMEDERLATRVKQCRASKEVQFRKVDDKHPMVHLGTEAAWCLKLDKWCLKSTCIKLDEADIDNARKRAIQRGRLRRHR